MPQHTTTPVKELTQKFHHNEIIKKCKHLFVDKELAAVTSDQISATAGYSKRTVYAYFTSKQDIFNSIQEHCLETFLNELSSKSFEGLKEFLEFIYHYKTTNSDDFFYILNRKFIKTNEDDYFYFSQKFKPLFDLLVDKYNFVYASLDIPLLIWNDILYTVSNFISLDIAEKYILKGLSQ